MNVDEMFQRLADSVFNRIQHSRPENAKLANCYFISHRGEHDNEKILENTLGAFDMAEKAGFWGIELDVRWTADLVPVIFHDADLTRLLGNRNSIGNMAYKTLKAEYPMVPTLEQVVQRYGGRLHLMVEIKNEPYPDPVLQNQIMENIFQELRPEVDYHFLALQPGMFEFFPFLPNSAFLPIARLSVGKTSRLAVEKGFGGITGHYALISRPFIRRHRQWGRDIGTGIVRSPNCLFREVERGVRWIFTENMGKWITRF